MYYLVFLYISCYIAEISNLDYFFVQCTPLIRILIYLKLSKHEKKLKKNYFPFHRVKNSLEPKNVFLKFKTFFLANVQCSMK